jgi:uncharacterized membrane protein
MNILLYLLIGIIINSCFLVMLSKDIDSSLLENTKIVLSILLSVVWPIILLGFIEYYYYKYFKKKVFDVYMRAIKDQFIWGKPIDIKDIKTQIKKIKENKLNV